MEEKSKELLKLDIIKPVDCTTPWVNPVVIMPNSQGKDVRLCGDMMWATKAIENKRDPIPTVEEDLQGLNSACRSWYSANAETRRRAVSSEPRQQVPYRL